MTATRCRQVRGVRPGSGGLGHGPEGRGRYGEGSAVPGASPGPGGSGAPGRAGTREEVGVCTLVPTGASREDSCARRGCFQLNRNCIPLPSSSSSRFPAVLLPQDGSGLAGDPELGSGSSSLCRWVVCWGGHTEPG